MPSLPFTFEDLRNLDIPAQAADTEDINLSDPQEFLGNAVEVKQQFGTTEGLIDTGLREPNHSCSRHGI